MTDNYKTTYARTHRLASEHLIDATMNCTGKVRVERLTLALEYANVAKDIAKDCDNAYMISLNGFIKGAIDNALLMAKRDIEQ